jgi:hypothetical protein
MAAGITDKFTSASNGTRPSPTTLTAIRSIGASSISCGALTGWPTATAVHFVIYTTDTSGNKVAGSQLDCKGIVSGTNITNIVYKAGNDTGNAIGAIVEAAPTAAWADDMVAGITAHANQDGSLITAAVRAALNLDAGTSTGWTVLGYALSTVLGLGNRSYQLTFNSNDLTTTVSPGMRLRFTRTVAATTQCTNLNGTTQYYSKSSPNKLTFTDTFTVSAWIKATSYQNGQILSRRTAATSGWGLEMSGTGQIQVLGLNAGSYRGLVSVQSIPLNKWVHVAGSFTMSTNTGAVYIDGVAVPTTAVTSGTPATLVQSGDLCVGAYTGGTAFFPGKIAQAAVYSAVLSAATILASIDRPLSGSETSLASAFSFSNSILDLNTTTPNDLTANGSAVATSTDSPFGGQADGTISSTLDYAIVQTVTFSTNTTMIVQVPEGCTIPSTGGVSAVSYSAVKVPFGFPSQRTKWDVLWWCVSEISGTTSASPSVYSNWTNANFKIPVGEWDLGFVANIEAQTAAAALTTDVGLGTTNASVVAGLTEATWGDNTSVTFRAKTWQALDSISLAAATVYYLNMMVEGGASKTAIIHGSRQAARMFARNAYL